MKINKECLVGFIFFILFLSIGFASASDAFELSESSDMDSFEDDSLAVESDMDSFEDDSLAVESDIDSFEDDSMAGENSNEDFANDLNYDSIDNEIDNEIDSIDDDKKISTKINAKKVSAYYKEKSSLVIFLKDSNNKSLKNKKVKISFNGKVYSRYTDKLGKITLNLNLKPKRYNVKISFAGDDEYEFSSSNTLITIKKAPLIIKTSNSKSYFAPETFFKAKVINKITKKPVEGIKVLFKVCSSKNKYDLYYSITDKKGMATLNKRLKTGFYDVYTYIKDNANRPFISYKNSKNKVTLRVIDTREMGCSSVYVHINENESAAAFRRDSTYAADLYVIAQRWYGRNAIKQYKLTGGYFFHIVVTSDGWLVGTGGADNPTINKKIQSLAGQMVSSNSLNSTALNLIKGYERSLTIGHFAIVAPNGRYAVVWPDKIIKGKLLNGEYLDVPNGRSLFRHGKSKDFSNNTAKAAQLIAATDPFGINRRDIMVYYYKRTTKDYKINASVKVYASNDKGDLVGRSTAAKKDNVNFKDQFFSKNSLPGAPSQKLLGKHDFGNIDKLVKIQTILSARNITGNYNQTKYFSLTLKSNVTKNLLKNVRVNLRIYTGKSYTDYLVRTDVNGLAKFNIKALSEGVHKVIISTANSKYLISGRNAITIKNSA